MWERERERERERENMNERGIWSEGDILCSIKLTHTHYFSLSIVDSGILNQDNSQ